MHTPRTIRYENCRKCMADEAAIIAVRVNDYAKVEAIECGCAHSEAEIEEIERRALEAEPERLADDHVDYQERLYDV